MANPSGIHQEVAQSSYGCGPTPTPSSFNGNSVTALEKSPGVLFHNTGLDMDWSVEEQAILEEGLVKYASESNVIRYAKIAHHLRCKTVRDVAMRCRWMVKKEISKRKKEELNSIRKNRERKEKINYPSAAPSDFAAPSSFPPYTQGRLTHDYDDGILYNAIGGAIGQLLQQNSQAFKQISANLAAHKINENIVLFCQAGDNILRIMDNLRNTPDKMKHMPPLPVNMNSELAESIFSLLSHKNEMVIPSQ